MITMDKELANAFGWLASNYSIWVNSNSETSIKLKEFFDKSGPRPEEQCLWAVQNRQQIIDLYISSK